MRLLTKKDALDRIKWLLKSDYFRRVNKHIEHDLLIAEIERNPNITQEVLNVASKSFNLTHTCDNCGKECESVLEFDIDAVDYPMYYICKDCLQDLLSLF
jgi:hypothetical protein